MLDYQFGQSMGNYDWLSGTFKDSHSPIGEYQNGFHPISLGVNLDVKPFELPDNFDAPQRPISTPPVKKKKKGKALIWVLLVLALIGLGFGLYKLKS